MCAPWRGARNLPPKTALLFLGCFSLASSSSPFCDWQLFEPALWNSTFAGGSEGKASACNAGDSGSIPVLGRSPGGGNGNPLQYSCLENPMDRRAWQATVHAVAKTGWLHFGTQGRSWRLKPIPYKQEGLPWWLRWKRIHLQYGRPGFDPWVGKIPLEDGVATHSSIFAWRIPMDIEAWQATVHRVAKSQTQLSD